MGAKRNAHRNKVAVQKTDFGELMRSLVNAVPRALALGVTAALLLFGFTLFEGLQRVPVERVMVLGTLAHTQENAVREALGPHLDSGLLLVDLVRLQDHLEDLPWVYRAEIRRRFPDTLEVRVVEQQPIARWGESGFLNHEARIISVADSERWRDLPSISGIEGSEGFLVERYMQLRERLASTGLVPRALQQDGVGQLFAILGDGIEVALGADQFTIRLERFVTLWESELKTAKEEIARVDLRYETGAAVAFVQEPQPQSSLVSYVEQN
ncbi:MAG: FtsQ-type POTRA domain-containing protein [Pseudomonadota bacterium]